MHFYYQFEFDRFTGPAPVLGRCRQVTSVCKGHGGAGGRPGGIADTGREAPRACAGKALDRFDVAGAVCCELAKPRREIRETLR